MEFLMDKRVIDYSFLFRKILVGGIIVPFRASKSATAYERIWTKEGSPLIVLTQKFCQSLREQINLPVEVSMRYGKPSMGMAFKKILESNPELEEVLAIPLYPHYAMSSFETAVVWAREIHARNHYSFKISFTRPFYNNDGYVHALSERIRPYLDQPYDHLLFSYHGIPERHLLRTDPSRKHCLQSINCCEKNSPAHSTCYRHQCFETTRLVTKRLNIPEKYYISFQSRL
jgi:ferrochelatase